MHTLANMKASCRKKYKGARGDIQKGVSKWYVLDSWWYITYAAQQLCTDSTTFPVSELIWLGSAYRLTEHPRTPLESTNNFDCSNFIRVLAEMEVISASEETKSASVSSVPDALAIHHRSTCKFDLPFLHSLRHVLDFMMNLGLFNFQRDFSTEWKFHGPAQMWVNGDFLASLTYWNTSTPKLPLYK